MDVAVIASMFNMNIGVFSYGSSIQPRWSWTSPDPLLTQYSTSEMDYITDMLVYHEDDNHYDLLVPRDSSLAIHGNVSNG